MHKGYLFFSHPDVMMLKVVLTMFAIFVSPLHFVSTKLKDNVGLRYRDFIFMARSLL